jgi:hypothetical protein
VAVLADPDEGDVDGRPLQQRSDAPALRGDVGGVARQEVEGRRVHALDDPLAQVAAEARRVRVADPDVLVEVEHLHARPVDARGRSESVQELELRSAGRRDHAGGAAPQKRVCDHGGRLRRRRASELALRVEDADLHQCNSAARAPTRNESHCLAISRW